MRYKAIRWSDHDHYFGPFTYAREKRNRRWAIVLGSGDDDDYPGCRLRVHGFGHSLLVALPPIIKPWRQWVEIRTEPTRSQIIAQGREPGYWDNHKREYGFSISDGFAQVFLGRQTHNSSTTQSWSKFLPWTQWRHVRHSLYGLTGELFAHLPQRPSYRVWRHRHDVERAIADACPTVAFDFDDFDGERITATTKIEEREWRFGEGWFKWLSLFRRPKIQRSLDLSFSAETGQRKGSWKGGTIGHSIRMLPGELHEAAFRRYCAEHEMTFVGPASGIEARSDETRSGSAEGKGPVAQPDAPGGPRMTPDLIKAARAMAEEDYCPSFIWDGDDPEYEHLRNAYVARARAAILSLMEPSDEVVEAGERAQAELSTNEPAFEVFTAMLSKMLG